MARKILQLNIDKFILIVETSFSFVCAYPAGLCSQFHYCHAETGEIMKKEKSRFSLRNHHQCGKVFWVSFVILIMVSTLIPNSALAQGPIIATTVDNVQLKLMRYSPIPSIDLLVNKHKQPILLLPGILANMNEFLCHTPDSFQARAYYSALELPSELAAWAQNDPFVQVDPMKYYSLAHALWVMGFDVWLANYRGVGRDEYASDSGALTITLDVWAALDTPAIIDKVLETVDAEKRIFDPAFNLVIGGHSTGGLSSYLYLSGVYIDEAERSAAVAGGYNPHTRVSDQLADARNLRIAGFLGIDPSGPPPFPEYELLFSTNAYWRAMNSDYVFPFDTFAEEHLVDPNRHFDNAAPYTIEALFGMIDRGAELFGNGEETDLFSALQMWNTEQTNPYVEDFFVRYASSNLYMKIMAQYNDWGVHQTLREHYRNGFENKDRIVPPLPGTPEDNLIDFRPHIINMKVPAYCVFSQNESLVSTATMTEIIYNPENLPDRGKTAHNNDTYWELQDSAHVDLPINEQSPVSVYPDIADWVSLIIQ